MGKELSSSRFNKQDFKVFEKCLRQQTSLLAGWFAEKKFSSHQLMSGFEMEAWLIDKQGRPAPLNDVFLKKLNNPLVVLELAKFNVELNGFPQPLQGKVFSLLRDELLSTIEHCRSVAETMNIDLLMTGILPTVCDDDLNLANMSATHRFKALNEQVLRLRQGRPLHLSIQGSEHLRVSHFDVMLEAAASSFQIHLQVEPAQAVRFYNAACIVSAPMVAVSANSPYLFGKDLWDETRIPLFEQSVELKVDKQVSERQIPYAVNPLQRVGFSSGYLQHSMLEAFDENLDCFPIMLPSDLSGESDPMAYVRLHNGTIWRWNRPLIGYDDDGTPHLRIENRVVPAGPSVADSIANAALFYGLVTALASDEQPPESLLNFVSVRENFYKAARLGMRASIAWLDGCTVPLRELFLEELLPLARKGLEQMEISRDDINENLEIIEGRVRSGMNGAGWQRAYVEKNNATMSELTSAYLERQKSAYPVHQWLL